MIATQEKMIAAIAAGAGITEFQAEIVLRTMAKEITRQMAAGDDVRLFGVGKLYQVDRKARRGRNNMTKGADGQGVWIDIPARKDITFKPKNTLLAVVRGE